MIYLFIASFIWALSFGLIKTFLSNVDSNFVSFFRMVLSFSIFAPLLRIHSLKLRARVVLVLIGAIQYGCMYLFYISSFRFLLSHEVALFTIFTPLYVTTIYDILKKRFHLKFLLCALAAVIGTAVILYSNINNRNLYLGFILVQFSNICFAFGQVAYKKIMEKYSSFPDYSIFGYLYLGAVVITTAAVVASAVQNGWSSYWQNICRLSRTQFLILFYLGTVPSGLCFFLWNLGAKISNSGTLAVLNNLKIPLAIACSIFLFGEKIDLFRLCVGSIIILSALFASESIQLKTDQNRLS